MTPIHSPSDVVRQVLIDLGYGTDPEVNGSWPVYASFEPNTPDECISVYDTAGVNFGRTQIDGSLQEDPGVTVRVRCRTHQVGYRKSSEIAKALDEDVRNSPVTIPAFEEVGTATYLLRAVQRTGSVIPIGADSPTSKRRAFTINATVTLERSS